MNKSVWFSPPCAQHYIHTTLALPGSDQPPVTETCWCSARLYKLGALEEELPWKQRMIDITQYR